MKENISVHFGYRKDGFSNNSVESHTTVDVPEICPHCGKNMVPMVLSAASPDYSRADKKRIRSNG